MTETVWVVERSYGRGEDIVTLVYATPDGSRVLQKQLSFRLVRRKEITAAKEVEKERLETVASEADQQQYADEVERVRERYEPDEEV